MKKHSLTALLFILFYMAQAQHAIIKNWDASLKGLKDEYVYDIKPTAGNGFLISAATTSGAGGSVTQPNFNTSGSFGDYWLVAVDGAGNKIFDRRYGGTGSENLSATLQLSNGNYLLAGNSNSGISGNKSDSSYGGNDIWILMTDSLGNILWDKDYGGTGTDGIIDGALYLTADGGFIMGGITNSPAGYDVTQGGPGFGDFWVLRIDSVGSKLWDKRFGGIGGEITRGMIKTLDGNYLLYGDSNSDISGDKTEPSRGLNDYWLVKIDSLGNKLWDKTVGTCLEDWLPHVIQGNDSCFILCGATNSGICGDKTNFSVNNSEDLWVVKLDKNGNKLWDKDFGGTLWEQPSCITATMDGGYIISSMSESPLGGNKTENNLGTEQTWLVKIDSAGIFEWDKTIFTNATGVYANNLLQTSDSCYVLFCSTNAGAAGYKSQANFGTANTSDIWLFSFCDSSVALPIKELHGNAGVTIIPNPVISDATVTVNGGHDAINYALYNMTGQVIVIGNALLAGNSFDIQMSQLPAGIYTLMIRGNENAFVKKLIKR